jgi:hypothetical protein
MKEWQVTLVRAFVIFATGIGIFLWSISLERPMFFSTLYPGYYLIADQYFLMFLVAVLFAGLDCGLQICSLLTYQLEKKLEFKV